MTDHKELQKALDKRHYPTCPKCGQPALDWHVNIRVGYCGDCQLSWQEDELSKLRADYDRVKAERDAWRTVGELVMDYCQRMTFETNGETRGDRMYAAVAALLKGSE